MRILAAFVSLLLCLSGPAAAAPLTSADRDALKRVETYLTGLTTVAAKFTQISQEGEVTNGQFYLQRPGKIRMQYDPPVPVLMITSGDNMVYYDSELDQVTHIPLGDSLVSFIAREKVRFDDGVTVTAVEQGQRTLRISLVQSDKPGDGEMTLELQENPMVIRNILVRGADGQVTTVSLSNAKFGLKLPDDLFVFTDRRLGNRTGGIQK